MSLISWDEKFSVGIEAIDTDHKILMDLINQLHDAYAAGKGGPGLEPVFLVLMEYVEKHFKREEALMARIGYPALDEHVQAHVDLRDEVEVFHEAWRGGQIQSVYLALLGFLNNWWHFHILEEDMGYKRWMEEQGVTE